MIAWLLVAFNAVMGASGAVIASLGALFGTFRAFLVTFAMKVVLAIVLYNLICEVLMDVFTWVMGKIGGMNLTPGGSVSSLDVGTYSSLAAWLVTTMKIPQCFSFMLAIILLKWTLRKIPIVRW